MTQMLALELAKHRIRVNVVCPGKIELRSRIAPPTAAARRQRFQPSILRATSH
jgi:NAD(P)-dependent dehydrogenase (short-subunit alcohol dehydrogenase family)